VKSLLVFALLTAATAAQAAVPNPPPLNGKPVVDAANILSPDDETALNAKLLNIQSRSKHQVAVLTVPSLGGYDIQTYSLNAARFYKLGSLDGDDGVLVTVAPNEHKVRIETGHAMGMLLTDAKTGLFINRDMIPAFKRHDYAGGINAGIDDIAQSIVPLTPAQLMERQREESERKAREAKDAANFKDWMTGFISALLTGLFGFITYRLVTAKKRREKVEAARKRAEQELLLERAKLHPAPVTFKPKRKRACDEGAAEQSATVDASEKRSKRKAAEESSSSSSSSSSYDYGSSSSSSSSSSDYGSSSSSSSDSSSFSGGGGSFDGGGSDGSW
jgi:uncharacterized membrane protein YgcG